MSRRNIINILLVVALLFVIISSINRTQHGNRAEWIKKHGEIVNRRGNPDRYCLKCILRKWDKPKKTSVTPAINNIALH